MLTIKKKALALSIMASFSLLSSPAFAVDTPPPADVSEVKLRIPIKDLVKANQLPSEFTLWKEFSERRDYTPWTPSTASIESQHKGDLGIVIKGSIRDTFVPDYVQERSFEVDEWRNEQKKIEDGRGDVVNDGDPIRHERTLRKDESRVVSVSNAEWRDTAAPSCTEYTAVGSKSRYLTPVTEQAEGQERTCKIKQTRNVTLNDPDGEVSFDQTRTLEYTETQTMSGLMTNHSCLGLVSHYNKYKTQILKASPGWSYNGWKQLNIQGVAPFVTYCSSGWTMVAAQFEGSPVPWTGKNQTNVKSMYGSKKGFSLPNNFIPNHSKWGVGRDTAITIKLDSGRYHTGNIRENIRGGGKTWYIDRDTGSHHQWHNPNAPVQKGAQWNNTLTFESSSAASGSHNMWAFSPNERAPCSRGWALNGYMAGNNNSHAWTVWVY